MDAMLRDDSSQSGGKYIGMNSCLQRSRVMVFLQSIARLGSRFPTALKNILINMLGQVYLRVSSNFLATRKS